MHFFKKNIYMLMLVGVPCIAHSEHNPFKNIDLLALKREIAIKTKHYEQELQQELDRQIQEQPLRDREAERVKEFETSLGSIDWSLEEKKYPTISQQTSLKDMYKRLCKKAYRELTYRGTDVHGNITMPVLSWPCGENSPRIATRFEEILKTLEFVVSTFGDHVDEHVVHVVLGDKQLLQSYLLVDQLIYMGFLSVELAVISPPEKICRNYRAMLLHKFCAEKAPVQYTLDDETTGPTTITWPYNQTTLIVKDYATIDDYIQANPEVQSFSFLDQTTGLLWTKQVK